MKGQRWWWYGVLLGLYVASLATPFDAFQRFVVPLTWLWPIFLWSAMGSRESRYRNRQLVFSCPRFIRRQLPALWLAGVLVAVARSGGAIVRLMIIGDTQLLFGWFVGVLFVRALALVLGVWTHSGRLFEMLYFAIWFFGIFTGGHAAVFDFLGRAHPPTPFYYIVITAVLLVLAVIGRRKQLLVAT